VIKTLQGLSEFDSTNTATIFYVHQLKLLVSTSKVSAVIFESAIDILFAARVEVDSRDRAIALVEANIVEAFKTCSSNRLNLVIRNQEVFFPSHKQMLALSVIMACEIGRFGVLSKGFPRWETRPVLHVDLFCRAPFRM
jgi:hypothetical protein